MIYVEFDKYGVLNTIDLNEETIFKGNNRVNKIFVYFDGIELKPTHYLTYSALVNENDYDGDLTDLASVRTTYNGKDGYTFYLFSNLTAQAGSLKLSVRLVNSETEEILVSGILPLIVQDSAISTYSNVNINTTQYQALLTAFDDLAQTLNEIDVEEINGLKDKVDVIETSVRMLGTANNNLFNAVENLQEENRNQNELINKHEKRIHTLELASEGNIIETIGEETTAYEYQITGNTLPYGTIDKLGGMTYKSDNILIYDDIPETTINGLTYHVENGIIYLNGTLTTKTAIQFNLTKPIVSGTYSYKNLGNGITDADSRLIMYKLGSSGSTSFVEDLLQNTTDTLNLSQEADVIKFSISAGTYTNATIKPMLVKGNTIPTKFIKGFEGLRNSAVNQVVVKGANLLNPSLLVTKDATFTKQSNDSYVSKALNSYGTAYFNATWSSQIGAMVSSEGISLNKGTYYISFKAKLNSGTSNGGLGISIALQNDKNIVGGIVLNPTISSSYQVYRRSFTLSSDDKIGFIVQVANGASNAVIQIKDIMIAKGETSYKPYKEPTTYTIPSTITSIDGYGIGVDETYHNYIDYENKKFVKHVKKVVSSSNQNFKVYATNTNGNVEITIGNVNTDLNYNERYKTIATTNINNALVKGYNNNTAYFVPTQSGNYMLINKTLLPNVDTYSLNSDAQKQYILDTLGVDEITAEYVIVINPLQADISTYIDDDLLEVEGGGTLVFENEHENAIPFAWTHQEKL